MRVLRFSHIDGDVKKDPAPLCLALGFFDSLHRGHGAVVGKALLAARQNGFKSAVFTFENNPFKVLGKDTRLVYTFPERCALLESMGADAVISAEFTQGFMAVPAPEFLEGLAAAFNIKYIACGGDYTFGQNSGGNTALLREFCARRGIAFEIAPEVTEGGRKISSTLIREKIAEGDIAAVNALLTAPFSVSGTVERGRGVGGRLGFPTANLIPGADKAQLGAGVYATVAYAGGEKYASVTNAGARPTFGEGGYGIETHIIGLNRNLYGENIKVEFVSKIRDIKKFASAEELKEQITADIECCARR